MMYPGLKFVCKSCYYIFSSWQLIFRAMSRLPANFPQNHCRPNIFETFTLQIELSDTEPEWGIAVISKETFREWIRKEDKAMIYTQLEAGIVLNREFTYIESFR